MDGIHSCTTHTLIAKPFPDSLNIQEPALCIAALHEAVAQLKAAHVQLQAAEGHIDLMSSRDTALLHRMREAETIARQARSSADKAGQDARKFEESSKAAELRAQKAVYRAFQFQETLTNINRRLKAVVGSSSGGRYQEHGVQQPVAPHDEANIHLQVLETVLSERSSTEAPPTLDTSHTHPIPTDHTECEMRSADQTHQISELTVAKTAAEFEVQKLTEQLSATRTKSTSALQRAKQKYSETVSRASEAEDRARHSQDQICKAQRNAAEFETRLQDASARVASAEEKLKEVQEASDKAHSACAYAVLQTRQEESERKVLQLALESIQAERESPLVVPALMDALRVISRSLA